MKVADYVVNMLYEAGVRRVYAVTGDSLNPINDAIRRDERLQWIQVRHEEAGAYAASMEAELNGIGCCMGSSGPGHVHLINGLYDANRSGNPVIAIASTVPTDKLGLGTFQETNVTKLFDDCSKYCFMANTPVQAANGLQSAIQHAIQERGVGVLGLPGDVADAQLGEVAISSKNYYTKARILPAEDEMNEIADIVNAHKKVMLFCGYGAKDAREEIRQLCEKINSPLGYTYRGKIFFNKNDNPYTVGMTGLIGNRAGFAAMNEADVVLMLGSDFPYSEFLPEKNKLIQIDIKPERLGRKGKVDFGYQGDIRETIKGLLPKITKKNDDKFLKEMRKIRDKNVSDYENYVRGMGTRDKIHPEYVASVINALATDDAIFTVDTGMSAVWAARYLRGGKNRYLTGSYTHGSMANAMPMAIGAGLSHPERQIIAFCGDGGISMLLGDLMTISQYQIPVKIVIFNNRSLGMVKLEMKVAGYVDWQTDTVNPDYKKVAEAMGIAAWEVRDSEKVEGALQEAFSVKGPALINIYTDPDALSMPPHADFSQVKGFATSMFKLVMNGQTCDVIDSAKSNMKYLRELF